MVGWLIRRALVPPVHHGQNHRFQTLVPRKGVFVLVGDDVLVNSKTF
jgi:hypothetical protein